MADEPAARISARIDRPQKKPRRSGASDRRDVGRRVTSRPGSHRVWYPDGFRRRPTYDSHDLCKVDFTLDESEDPRFPHWPCPECGHGVLQLAGRSIRFALSAGMSFAIDLDPLANFEAYGAFCATMVCVNEACSQGVVVIGDYSTHTPEGMYYSGRGGYDFPVARKYVINAIHPAFRLINIPQASPPPILAPLEESFALYWGHPRACAASISHGDGRNYRSLGATERGQRKICIIGTALSKT
jgi:hypothetical protein